MASTTLGDPSDYTTQAAVQEKAKLQRHFGRFDMLFFLLCTLVGLDTLGAVSTNGAQAFTWLAFLGIFFFVPYALLTAELGSTFTEEGGQYVWTRMAFGRLVAAVNSVIYWVANPIWLGGLLTITAVSVFSTFYTPLTGFWKYAFAIVFIWFAVVAAILSFGIGKWIPTVGAIGRILLLSFFTLSVIIYGFKHGVHGFGASSFKPTYTIFIAAVPVLFFNYVGFELPNAAGDEMMDAKRDVPYTVIRSAIGTFLLYGAPVLAILLVLPTSQITSLGGFIDAIKTVFTVYGGHVASDGTATLTGAGKVLGDIAAAGFIWALASSGTTWIMGADRSQAVAAFDGAGPRVLGIFSARFGTPIVVNILSGIVSTITMVLAFNLTGGNSGKYFSAVLGLAISTTTISYIAIFPTLVKLRKSHPDVPRPYSVPGGMAGAWVCSILCTLWSVFATVVLLYPGIGTSHPNDSLPTGFAGERLQYELSQIVPLLVLFAVGVLFYFMGRQTREHLVPDPELAPALATA